MLQSTKGFNERNFAWSSDKKLLAFNRMRTDLQSGFYDDLLPVENWETVVVDPEKDLVLTTITESSNPQWSPDGSKLVYLKRDGLYVRDISGTDGKRVVAIPEDGVVTTMSMIAVSPDGKKLLWSIAKAGVITLYEIIDWETFTITEKARMQTEGVEYYWPLFSPDSNFFAVQAIDALKGDALFRENPRMEIRGIGNREPSQVVSLTEFNFDQLFTDTWVEKIQ
jgi:hypothetical protein